MAFVVHQRRHKDSEGNTVFASIDVNKTVSFKDGDKFIVSRVMGNERAGDDGDGGGYIVFVRACVCVCQV